MSEPIQRFLIGEGERFYLDENGDDPMFTIESYHVNRVVCQKCGGGFGSVINTVDVRGIHRHVCDHDTVYVEDGYLSPLVDYKYYADAMRAERPEEVKRQAARETYLQWRDETP
jgi:hypothetical protein